MRVSPPQLPQDAPTNPRNTLAGRWYATIEKKKSSTAGSTSSVGGGSGGGTSHLPAPAATTGGGGGGGGGGGAASRRRTKSSQNNQSQRQPKPTLGDILVHNHQAIHAVARYDQLAWSDPRARVQQQGAAFEEELGPDPSLSSGEDIRRAEQSRYSSSQESSDEPAANVGAPRKIPPPNRDVPRYSRRQNQGTKGVSSSRQQTTTNEQSPRNQYQQNQQLYTQEAFTGFQQRQSLHNQSSSLSSPMARRNRASYRITHDDHLDDNDDHPNMEERQESQETEDLLARAKAELEEARGRVLLSSQSVQRLTGQHRPPQHRHQNNAMDDPIASQRSIEDYDEEEVQRMRRTDQDVTRQKPNNSNNNNNNTNNSRRQLPNRVHQWAETRRSLQDRPSDERLVSSQHVRHPISDDNNHETRHFSSRPASAQGQTPYAARQGFQSMEPSQDDVYFENDSGKMGYASPQPNRAYEGQRRGHYEMVPPVPSDEEVDTKIEYYDENNQGHEFHKTAAFDYVQPPTRGLHMIPNRSLADEALASPRPPPPMLPPEMMMLDHGMMYPQHPAVASGNIQCGGPTLSYHPPIVAPAAAPSPKVGHSTALVEPSKVTAGLFGFFPTGLIPRSCTPTWNLDQAVIVNDDTENEATKNNEGRVCTQLSMVNTDTSKEDTNEKSIWDYFDPNGDLQEYDDSDTSASSHLRNHRRRRASSSSNRRKHRASSQNAQRRDDDEDSLGGEQRHERTDDSQRTRHRSGNPQYQQRISHDDYDDNVPGSPSIETKQEKLHPVTLEDTYKGYLSQIPVKSRDDGRPTSRATKCKGVERRQPGTQTGRNRELSKSEIRAVIWGSNSVSASDVQSRGHSARKSTGELGRTRSSPSKYQEAARRDIKSDPSLRPRSKSAGRGKRTDSFLQQLTQQKSQRQSRGGGRSVDPRRSRSRSTSRPRRSRSESRRSSGAGGRDDFFNDPFASEERITDHEESDKSNNPFPFAPDFYMLEELRKQLTGNVSRDELSIALSTASSAKEGYDPNESGTSEGNAYDEKIQRKLDAVKKRSMRNVERVKALEDLQQQQERQRQQLVDSVRQKSKTLRKKQDHLTPSSILHGDTTDASSAATPFSNSQFSQGGDELDGHFMYVAYSRFGNDARKTLQLCEHQSIPTPDTRNGEVLIRIQASSVSATDCAIRRGEWPADQVEMNPYIIPGAALVGRVYDPSSSQKNKRSITGPAFSYSTAIHPGDMVVSLVTSGANARYTCLSKTQLVKVPPQLDPDQTVCLVETYLTAFQALHHGQKGGVRYRENSLKGRSVLILDGYTTLGRALVELAIAAGAQYCYVLAETNQHQYRRDRRRGNGGIRYPSSASQRHFEAIARWGGIPLSKNPQDWLTLIGRQIDLLVTIQDPSKRCGSMNTERISNDHWKALRKDGKAVVICAQPGMSDPQKHKIFVDEGNQQNDVFSSGKAPRGERLFHGYNNKGGLRINACRLNGREKFVDRTTWYNLFETWNSRGTETASPRFLGNRSKSTNAHTVSKRDLEHLLRLLELDRIHPDVLERIPLSKVAQAQSILEGPKLGAVGHLVCAPWLKQQQQQQQHEHSRTSTEMRMTGLHDSPTLSVSGSVSLEEDDEYDPLDEFYD